MQELSQSQGGMCRCRWEAWRRASATEVNAHERAQPSSLTNLHRSFSADCIRRIQWLEQIIHTHLPQIDLSTGPKLDGSTKALLDSTPAQPKSTKGTKSASKTKPQVESSFTTSHETITAPGPSQPFDCATSQSQPDCWESPPGDSNIANEVRAVAQSLGQVSLHEDSRQTYYLGTSTGILFAHLVGASASSLHSSPDPIAKEAPNPIDQASLEELRELLRRVSELRIYSFWLKLMTGAGFTAA